MTQLATPPSTTATTVTTPGRPARAPWPVTALVTLVTLLALVTSYGSIYFTFYFGDPDPTLASGAFVALFFAISATAVLSAVALRGGSRAGWRLLVGYGVLGILWCIAKLVFWQETESLVFGVANVVVLVLLAATGTRRHVG